MNRSPWRLPRKMLGVCSNLFLKNASFFRKAIWGAGLVFSTSLEAGRAMD